VAENKLEGLFRSFSGGSGRSAKIQKKKNPMAGEKRLSSLLVGQREAKFQALGRALKDKGIGFGFGGVGRAWVL